MHLAEYFKIKKSMHKVGYLFENRSDAMKASI